MANKTVTSLFQDHHAAQAAVSRLEEAGISGSRVRIYDQSDESAGRAEGGTVSYSSTAPGELATDRFIAGTAAAPYAGIAAVPYAETADVGATGPAYSPPRLEDGLTDVGVEASDAHAYAEGVRRGQVLVVVACYTDEVDQVITALDQDGIHDLDERRSAWRAEGWQDYQARADHATKERTEPVRLGRVRVHASARSPGTDRP